MDLDEKMVLTYAGEELVIPAVNIMRLGLTKLSPYIIAFQSEYGKDAPISQFIPWISEKLGMTGKHVLL